MVGINTHPGLNRFAGNPVLTPEPGHWWESKAVFNPGAIYLNGKVHIVYRAIGDSNISTIGYASSTDGFHIDERLDDPVYTPTESFEGVGKLYNTSGHHQPSLLSIENGENYISGGGWGGCEDPRLTCIDNIIYMTYVAFDGHSRPRLALTSINSDDFLSKNWQWRKPVLISRPGVIDKNACILPEKINSRYVIFHRIFPHILIDFVDSLEFDGMTGWLKGESRIKTRASYWDSRKVGAGAPPIKTEYGWLLIYHGVDERDPGRYKIGAMLLDLKDPVKVISRLNKPILQPEAWYENEGWKSGVVYPCGAVIIKDQLLVYYGGADKVTCIASAELDDILNGLIDSRMARPGKIYKPSEEISVPSPLPAEAKRITAYCMKCRAIREMEKAESIILKNGRTAVRGKCRICGINIFRIIKH